MRIKAVLDKGLVDRVRQMFSQTESICQGDSEIDEAAAMVLIGDVYALREPIAEEKSGWGSRCYVCDAGCDPL